MSPTRSASAGSSGGGRGAFTALIVVVVAVAMVLLLRTRPDVQSFDPRSSAPDGADGAVLLLERYGASVSITSSASGIGDDERVLVIADRLNNDQRRDLLEFVQAGGLAVVADPASSLHGGPGLDGGAVEIVGGAAISASGQLDASAESNVRAGTCTVAALEGLRGVYAPTGVLFPTAPDEQRCFGEGDHAFVVVRHYGDGLVIGFGDNHVMTNQYLRFADNAGLVTSLLAPTRDAKVRILLGTEAPPSVDDIGQGDETLVDLVRPGVWMGLTQLALAFVVLGIARGIRPGRAVRETLPTPIAGNELVVATGNLMQRAHHFSRAGWLIRTELHRQLAVHHRIPADATLDGMSRTIGERTGVDPVEISELVQRDVTDAAGLTRLRHDIDRLRARTIITTPTPERAGKP